MTLDRLKGEGWAKRRAEVSRLHVDEAAEQLVALAKAREARTCAIVAAQGRLRQVRRALRLPRDARPVGGD